MRALLLGSMPDAFENLIAITGSYAYWRLQPWTALDKVNRSLSVHRINGWKGAISELFCSIGFRGRTFQYIG